MLRRNLAITGGSSASALWIAKTFKEKGWAVDALCAQEENSYDSIKGKRIHFLKKVSRVSFGLRSESQRLLAWIEKNKPTIWIHHHHHMKDYRSPNYDLGLASKVGVEPIPKIVDALKANKCEGIIVTGSYFETGEGGDAFTPPTPYGISKTQATMAVMNAAQVAGIKCTKIICPDLVGPLENEDRFLPQMIACAREKKPFELRSPEQIADHLPFEDLGQLYSEVAENLLKKMEGIHRPSGLIASQESWLREISEKLLSKMNLKLNCILDATSPKTDRFNPAIERRKIDWDRFWNNYMNYYITREPWRAKS